MSMRVVGKIIGAHGIKGELRVLPLVDDLSLFTSFTEFKHQGKVYKIENSRTNKNIILVKVEGIDDRSAAENIKGEIEADLEEELADNEFYIDDLIGLNVSDEKGNNIGACINFSKQGQALLFIKLNDSFGSKRDLIVPFVEEYIMDVSLAEKKIQIKLSPDLLELAQ